MWMVALISLMLLPFVFGIIDSGLLQIIHDSCSEVESNSSDFWVMVAALKVRHYNLTWIFDSVACSCFPMTVLEVKFTCIKVCRNDPFRIISWLDWQTCCGTLGKMKLASWVSWWIMLLVETLGSLIIFSYLLVWTKFWSSIWMSWSYAPYLEVFFNHLIGHYAWMWAHEFLLFGKRVKGLLEVWV